MADGRLRSVAERLRRAIVAALHRFRAGLFAAPGRLREGAVAVLGWLQATVVGVLGRWLLNALDRLVPPRLIALSGVAVLLGAFLSVLHRVMVVLGDPLTLYVVVAAAALAGAVLSKVVRPGGAVLLGGFLVVAGTGYYVSTLPGGVSFLALAAMMGETVVRFGEFSVMRIVNAHVWAPVAAIGPVFLSTYFGLRGSYAAATGVVGVALGVTVLSGDAAATVAFAGVVGGVAAVAFGDCARRGERLRETGWVGVAVAGVVVLTLVVATAPGAIAAAVPSDTGSDAESPTMETSLVYAGDRVEATGSVRLSPESRFRIEADEGANWRVASYDRYTGDGWVRTDETTADGDLRPPPGETRTVTQNVTAQSDIATLPAAWRPVDVEDAPVPVRTTPSGDLEPGSPLEIYDNYTVRSERPNATPEDLRDAGTDYPDGIERRYTQLPSSTPDRVADRTEDVVGDADNPYDAARTIEATLRSERRYSLTVEEPSGDIADQFLFEMEAGYCVYYASTMAVMLRTQGVPARFVTGYSTGDPAGENEWVVRGSHSHAWVEVYFPEHGWVEFDPTPSPAQSSAEQRLLEAAAVDPGDVETNESALETTDGGDDESEDDPSTGIEGPTPSDRAGDDDADATDDDLAVPVPGRERVGLGIALLIGLAVGVRGAGLDRRLRRAVWLRRIPHDEPEAIVEGAYRRILALESREKAPSETPRSYLADADPRARRIGAYYERARYGHGVTEEEAAAAVADFRSLLAERTRRPARLPRIGRDDG